MDENIELVRELNGVKYFCNHNGNTPDQTVALLEALNQKVILIAAGYEDKASCDSLGNALVEKVKHLILFGQTTAMIEMNLKAGCRLRFSFIEARGHSHSVCCRILY
jgi:UDP-N-acetylmuramoylalanine--D-glutamate ligase